MASYSAVHAVDVPTRGAAVDDAMAVRVEVEGRLLKARLGERLVGAAEPVRIAASMIEADLPDDLCSQQTGRPSDRGSPSRPLLHSPAKPPDFPAHRAARSAGVGDGVCVWEAAEVKARVAG